MHKGSCNYMNSMVVLPARPPFLLLYWDDQQRTKVLPLINF